MGRNFYEKVLYFNDKEDLREFVLTKLRRVLEKRCEEFYATASYECLVDEVLKYLAKLFQWVLKENDAEYLMIHEGGRHYERIETEEEFMYYVETQFGGILPLIEEVCS